MLLLVHGWGFDATLWHPMRAHLREPAVALDLGYLAAAHTPDLTPQVIGIGHSLGALWLLHTMPQRLAGFIAIAGFARFTAAPDWPGNPARPLHRMRQAFAARPDETLDAFRATCAAPAWTAPRHDPALSAGLDALATWDARETLRRLRIPTLVLAAPDDPIVPLPLAHATAALAAAPCRLVPSGGHLLPITQPAWCAAEIAAFLAR